MLSFLRSDIVDIIGHTDTKIISDSHLSKLVRQMAVHANVSFVTLPQLTKLTVKKIRDLKLV